MPEWYLEVLKTARELGYTTKDYAEANPGLLDLFRNKVCDWYPEDIREGRPHGEHLTMHEWEKRHGSAEGKL